ncbi:hypothetical protein RJT34_12581 [Clitoria ternatea]|uniref:Uncharacterized protein n=1 Tax=Clitoria ternatea TaxID=43366 RepID=A0AAN9JP35_CLITE
MEGASNRRNGGAVKERWLRDKEDKRILKSGCYVRLRLDFSFRLRQHHSSFSSAVIALQDPSVFCCYAQINRSSFSTSCITLAIFT